MLNCSKTKISTLSNYKHEISTEDTFTLSNTFLIKHISLLLLLMRIRLMRENWQANGMSHGKNYRLGFRSLRFYCSTTSMLNQLPDLHLWVNANFSDAQHFYLENEVSGSSEDALSANEPGWPRDQKNREIWTCQNSFIDFLKNYSQPSKGGDGNMHAHILSYSGFFKPHPVQKDCYINFFPNSLEYLQGEKLWWVCIICK